MPAELPHQVDWAEAVITTEGHVTKKARGWIDDATYAEIIHPELLWTDPMSLKRKKGKQRKQDLKWIALELLVEG